jgi:osmotically-inducible protein OsmY
MSESVLLRTDHEIRADVERELDSSPGIDSSLIGVAVHDGVVALSGEVPNHWQRATATNATLRTQGVTSVANDIAVRAVGTSAPTDAQLAETVRDALQSDTDIPRDAVLVEVHRQVVTLSGSVDNPGQCTAAHDVVQALPAVRGVVNRIGVQTKPSSVHTQIMIKSALIQNAVTDADSIEVHVEGTKIRLTGTVASEAERKAALNAAKQSAQVSEVVDNLEVRP